MDRKFYCNSECGKSFTHPHNLKRHIVLKHLKTKVFACKVCQKVLSSAQNLNEHEFKHEGRMPYECIKCKATFRYCSQLSKHKKHHKTMSESVQIKELKVNFI